MDTSAKIHDIHELVESIVVNPKRESTPPTVYGSVIGGVLSLGWTGWWSTNSTDEQLTQRPWWIPAKILIPDSMRTQGVIPTTAPLRLRPPETNLPVADDLQVHVHETSRVMSGIDTPVVNLSPT